MRSDKIICWILFMCLISYSPPMQAQTVSVIEDPSITSLMNQFIQINKSKSEIVGWRIQLSASTDRKGH